MLRNAILLLVFSWGLHSGSSFAAAAATEIETVNESQSVFDLGGSRISVEIRDRVLRGKGVRGLGVTVLVTLYPKMKADPFPVDLDKMWQELGVAFENDAIVYDDAPLAHIRKAILKS